MTEHEIIKYHVDSIAQYNWYLDSYSKKEANEINKKVLVIYFEQNENEE